ncbi:DUF4142 domain-containing protein [Rhizobium etli]|uniref:DUF4142 domain-containing protein n=1 Tax=Rhizobium etli TaxID=29449 RepID=UPI001FD4D457|nr:DUF4142 domain-containing protein [Rhizobium etli]
MVLDHTEANAKLVELADAAKIPLPTTLDPDHQVVRDQLDKLSGAPSRQSGCPRKPWPQTSPSPNRVNCPGTTACFQLFSPRLEVTHGYDSHPRPHGGTSCHASRHSRSKRYQGDADGAARKIRRSWFRGVRL